MRGRTRAALVAVRSAVAAALVAAPGPARADSPPEVTSVPDPQITATKPAPEPKRTAWSFGLSGMRREMKSGNDDELLGNSASIQIGTAYISDAWYADVSIDIIMGPYEPARQKQVDADFNGTGLTIWLGISAQSLNLRSAEGGYGFALGLSYADISGRSLGENRFDNGTSVGNQGLVYDYTMHVTDFSILPAIFFSWLTPARPHGNTPDLLMTRIEGYFLTIGAAMPLQTTYSSSYTVSEGADKAGVAQEEHGKLKGYSVLITVKAMLGT